LRRSSGDPSSRRRYSALRWQVGRPPPSGKGKVARKHAYRPGQTRERIPSNAWARKIAAPTKPITAVIVSIIANVPLRPARQKTAATLHSQKDFPAPTHNPDRPRILRNRRGSSVIQWPAQQLSGRPAPHTNVRSRPRARMAPSIRPPPTGEGKFHRKACLFFAGSFGLNAGGDASIATDYRRRP